MYAENFHKTLVDVILTDFRETIAKLQKG